MGQGFGRLLPTAARPGLLIPPALSPRPLYRDRRKFTTKWAVSVNSMVFRPPGQISVSLIPARARRGRPESP